jgi:superfamily II DNA or RNA helicase
MSAGERRDEPLFIVDNAADGRSGLDYLRQWCEVARAFDIATGFFEVGALLALDGHWQRLDRLRILMGDQVSRRTRKALLEAVKARATAALDASLEADKGPNPFLEGVDAIVEALRTGRIECRVYNRDKFHAKAYITHGRLDVIGSQALVGSSNLTVPGLTENVELNIKIESSSEVAQLQEWYERHWREAVDVTPDVLRTIERHVAAYTPFDVYTRALHELLADSEPTTAEWERSASRLFGLLDRYQQEAYWAMVHIAQRHGGAFLCDGVGLGKTYVGLMLIERLVVHERKNVVLFAPKSARDSVWLPALRRFLPHIGGYGGAVDFSNLSVFAHTDLSRRGEFPERFARVAERADAVVIDEAHHFRNPGKVPDPAEPESRTRYYRLYDLLAAPDGSKPLYLLTATPVNNTLHDFRHLVELFTRRNDAHFARSLGVNSVMAHTNALMRDLRSRVGDDAPVSEHATDAQELLRRDVLFNALVVQRSRAYARRSQEQERGSAAVFPDRDPPQVAAYSIRKTYGRLLEMLEEAFERRKPLFALPIYYPLAYYTGPDAEIDPLEENRQAQVVGLIRTNFLKRFESSVYAFERSCDRLMRRLMAFVKANAHTAKEQRRFEQWVDQHDELLGYAQARQLEFWADEGPDEQEAEEDVVPPELLEVATVLDPAEYDVAKIIQETYLDLDQLADFLDETRRFEARHDDKLQKLVRLLRSKELSGRKVLIFTEFADTARYLHRQLTERGIDRVAQIDSGTKTDRAEVLRRFSPYYNGSSSAELRAEGMDEIRVLVATDVLSEGLNLQDATRLVNYDIHWNPVRLMQRIGRVDRRLDPEVERRMTADHPELAATRGRIRFWNFLPPGELDTLLRLYGRVSNKVLLISKTFGIEGRQLLTPDDDYEALREFNAAYEGTTTPLEELQLEYQRLLQAHPGLEARLDGFPSGVFSGRARPAGAPVGVFSCWRLPAFDTEHDAFTLEAGPARWYFTDLVTGAITDDPAVIADWVRSEPTTPRRTAIPRRDLVAARDEVARHIRNTYLKQVGAPIDAPRPRLVCWLELNDTAGEEGGPER